MSNDASSRRLPNLYVRVRGLTDPKTRKAPPTTASEIDYENLADMCLRHMSEDCYAAAERLAEQLKLKPADRLRLRNLLRERLRQGI